jgi:hypothetical protein
MVVGRMSLPTPPVLQDLLALAVSKTALKDLIPPDEFRAWFGENAASVTAGDRLRLQPVWDQFAGKPGFDAKVAACPMCWLKTLEPRLGASVELPTGLAGLKASEVATQAAKFFVKREDVDRLLGEAPANLPTRSTTPLPGSVRTAAAGEPGALPIDLEPGAAPIDLEPGAPAVNLDPVYEPEPAPVRQPTGKFRPKAGLSPERRRIVGMIAGAVSLGSLLFLAVTTRQSCAKSPTAISAPAGLPVKPGGRLGRDARFVLEDPAWKQQPAETRTQQLRDALDSLRGSGIDNLVVVDANGKLIATAQWHELNTVVRFY